MTLKLTDEKLHSLVEAVEKATGRRPHLSTCIRWCLRPSSGIRLESIILGGRRLTSEQAVIRYMEAITAAKDGAVSAPPQSPAASTRAAQRSADALKRRLAV